MFEVTEKLADQLLEKKSRENYAKLNEKQRSKLCKRLETALNQHLSEKHPDILIDYSNLKYYVKQLLANRLYFGPVNR